MVDNIAEDVLLKFVNQKDVESSYSFVLKHPEVVCKEVSATFMKNGFMLLREGKNQEGALFLHQSQLVKYMLEIKTATDDKMDYIRGFFEKYLSKKDPKLREAFRSEFNQSMQKLIHLNITRKKKEEAEKGDTS